MAIAGWSTAWRPRRLRIRALVDVTSLESPAVCSDIHEKVILLEMGADDYITKPFSPRELLARLRVALRHSKPVVGASQVVIDCIVVDFLKNAGNPKRYTSSLDSP